MSEISPLPCPFCGHVGLTFTVGSTFRWLAYSCGGCGMGTETRLQTMGEGTCDEWRKASEQRAVEEWNTRADDAALTNAYAEGRKDESEAQGLPAPDLLAKAGQGYALGWSESKVRAAIAQERERCALVCDDEARIRSDAASKHPEGSDSRGRCYAAARAAINCAKGIRNGEVHRHRRHTRREAMLSDRQLQSLRNLGGDAEDAADEIVELRARAAQAAEAGEADGSDAARYRFLKSWFSPMGLNIGGNHSWTWRGSPARLTGANLDEAIDAALKGDSQGEKA